MGGFRSPMLRLVKDGPVPIDQKIREREQVRASVDAVGNAIDRAHRIAASLKVEKELMRLAFLAGDAGDPGGKEIYETAVRFAIAARARAEKQEAV